MKELEAIIKMPILQLLIIFIAFDNFNFALARSCSLFEVGKYSMCADGRTIHKGYFCGVGSCNLFGYNCNGGCRSVFPIKQFDILAFKTKDGYHAALAVNETHIVHNNGRKIKYDDLNLFKNELDNGEVVKLNHIYVSSLNQNRLSVEEINRNIEEDIGQVRNDLEKDDCQVFISKWIYGRNLKENKLMKERYTSFEKFYETVYKNKPYILETFYINKCASVLTVD